MGKRVWWIVGLALALGCLPAACRPTPTPQIIEKAATVIVEQTRLVEKIIVVTATPAPTPTPEEVTIVWWTDTLYQNPRTQPAVGQAPGAYEQMIAAGYMAEHPNVKIEVTALDWADLGEKTQAAWDAGAPPDIMKDYLRRSAAYARQGALVDMNALLPAAALDDILPALRDIYTIGGELHAFPAYFVAQHLIYNEALLEAAGLAGRAPAGDAAAWTFEEYAALGEAIKGKAGVETLLATTVAPEQGDYVPLAFLRGAGASVWKEDCSGLDLDSAEALAGMTYLLKLYEAGLLNADAPTAGLEEVETLMTAGRALSAGGSLYTLGPALQAARKEGRVRSLYKPQIAPYPHAQGQEPAGLSIIPTGYFVFKRAGRSAAQLQAIADFLLYINGEKWLRDGCINSGQLPALRSVGAPLAGSPEYEQALRWAQRRGVVADGLQCAGYAEVRAAMPAFFQAMLQKRATPQEALNGLMAQASEIIARNR